MTQKRLTRIIIFIRAYLSQIDLRLFLLSAEGNSDAFII